MSKKSQEIQNELKKKMIQQQLQKSLQLRRKIVNKQLDRIQNMPLSQLMSRQRRSKTVAPTDHTKKYFQKQINSALQQSGFQSTLDNPAQKHAEIFKQTQQRVKQYRKQLKKHPVLAQVKRGKLGVDNIFIAFGIMGFIFLPYYFGKRIKQNQQKIVESRGVDPKIIQNLDQDSPISIDSVSQQSIHYLNKERERQIKKKIKIQNKISQLQKELDR